MVDSYDGRFIIDRNTGLISTAASLDREQRTEYLLVVMATDSGLLAQSSTASVLVRVEDVNDHAPQFQRRSYVTQIRDGILPGLSVVCKLLSMNSTKETLLFVCFLILCNFLSLYYLSLCSFKI